MRISNYLSNKIKILSFLLTVLIVVLHANMEMLCTGWCSLFQHMMTAEITRIAVPLFYLISGFLFFINYHGTLEDYKLKLLSRTRSLLIPYLFFLLCGSIVIFVIGRVYTINALIEIIKNGIVGSPPIFYPLWFLRDLYVMVLVSPLVYWIIRKLPIILLVPIVIWILGKNPFVFPMTEAMLFFSLGGFLTTKHELLEQTNHRGVWWYISLWVLFSFLNTYIGKNIVSLPYATHCVILLLGIYAVWILYDRLYMSFDERIKNADIYKYSFLIFLIHEPILTIIKKTGLYFLGQTSWAIGVIYVLAPIFTICIVYMLGRTMKRYTPRILAFVTGGRTSRV